MRSKKLLKLSLEQYTWNYVLCTCSHTCEGPILWRSLMKLRFRNMYTKTKIPFKFGSHRTVYREMRSKKVIQIATWTIHVKLRFMYMLSTHVEAPYFGASQWNSELGICTLKQRSCLSLVLIDQWTGKWGQKSYSNCHLNHTLLCPILSHMWRPHTLALANETQN